jgi:hypothetical protein
MFDDVTVLSVGLRLASQIVGEGGARDGGIQREIESEVGKAVRIL